MKKTAREGEEEERLKAGDGVKGESLLKKYKRETYETSNSGALYSNCFISLA